MGAITTQDPIAIVGISCRLPGNNNSPASLWSFLENGRCAETSAPDSRFNLKGHFDASRRRNTLKSPGAMFLEHIDLSEFDARFFSISAQEAIAMDPQQRQLLEVVYECLENAGITMPALDGQPVGCFVASSTSDYRDIHARDPEDRPANATVGLVPAILSNRISHFLNLKGPSMTLDTACSSSLVSIDVANKYLQAGDIKAAIVAGVHLWLSPEANMDHGAMREAFSSSGKCHSFDAKADGYIKAEGVNAVLLKRLDDALRDGDPIRAVIRGTATNSDGRTAGIANPSGEAQSEAIRTAYARAGITDYTQTAYLECHGTGTLAGDPEELSAASAVLCKDRTAGPLLVGSIKSNIGHSECSAGISGLIKTAMILERGVIPGNPTFITPNPKIDFERLNVQASNIARPWPDTVVRRASVNSFGFGGSNAHLIVEEAKPWSVGTYVSSYKSSAALDDFFADEEDSTAAGDNILVFSSNDEEALHASAESVRRHLLRPTVKVNLSDLAFTLSERRTRHFYRGFLVTGSAAFELAALVTGKKSAKVPRIGFVFTGQGAQWPQMGRLLRQRFPLVNETFKYLDVVLKRCSFPPDWSLLDELCEPRSAEHLRQPELSQTLATAVQIALIDLLGLWGIFPHAVVGHSSGEIAAAYCAGHLSKENAIKVAFYRGRASSQVASNARIPQGMLAVGLGLDAAAKYLIGLNEPVTIACYNSPKSVTLSGSVDALSAVEGRVRADGYFARTLHVSVAYHSKHVSSAADQYGTLLDVDCSFVAFNRGHVRMFSTVSGQELKRATDAEYWMSNMTSPVRFDQAVEEMTGRASVDFLIELGPSGALAGPIAEILAPLRRVSSEVRYLPAMKRGQVKLESLLAIAGHLSIAGYSVDLRKVNEVPGDDPRIIVDLPNYVWNHTTKYWHESESSKDWRFRLFPPHDLIGSKVLGTTWHAPTWKIDLDVNNVPWLKDHKLGTDIVIPGAALMVMAVEAMAQRVEALHLIEGKPMPRSPRFRIRNITFTRALVLQQGHRQAIKTELRARSGSRDTWLEFAVRSLVNGSWMENSRGLVKVEEDSQVIAAEEYLQPLQNSVSGRLWYEAMEAVGYALGPAFQKHLEAEALSGCRNSRSLISLQEPPTKIPQTQYSMHPTTVDTILQACAPALWNGNRTNINAVIIPAQIDEAVISRQRPSATTGMLVASSVYSGLGDPAQTKNYTADVSVYDKETGIRIFQLSRLRTNVLNTKALDYQDPKYCQLVWRPDISFSVSSFAASQKRVSVNSAKPERGTVEDVLSLTGFKKPNQNVLECVLLSTDHTSIWLDNASVVKYASFHLEYANASALLRAQEKYGLQAAGVCAFDDLANSSVNALSEKPKRDLLILRAPILSKVDVQKLVRTSRILLHDDGHLLWLQHKEQGSPLDNGDGTFVDDELAGALEMEGFRNVRILSGPTSSGLTSAYFATKSCQESPETAHPSAKKVHVVHFSDLPPSLLAVIDGLRQQGWEVAVAGPELVTIPKYEIVMILEDSTTALLSAIDTRTWQTLQALFTSGHKVLWLTEGSQSRVTKPENAQIHGLIRTIRDEDPSINITTLDLEGPSGSVECVHAVLEHMRTTAFQKTGDYEFAEMGGVIHVSRVLEDVKMDEFSRQEREGSELCERSFFDMKSRYQIVSERVGNLDSLHFHETEVQFTKPAEGEVTIQIAATGLNFKDIAISTGLIPGNERLLGFEGSGTVIYPGSSWFSEGQRVVFTSPGSLANRINVKADLVYPIPDTMTFEQAATVGAVYPVALYSLFALADARKGHRVLVHSAAGGIGIACIHICQSIGAEVYATVGNHDKRAFLTEKFGIDPSRIFSSRSVSFATELAAATDGEGVDIIINSLTGELLEESWALIRDGGVMVELGKRDINERNYLPMEPFARNVSFRSFDISHRSVPDNVMARLLKQTFDLLASGSIKAIEPMTIFPLHQVTEAFRYMRDGRHMGKIVISSGTSQNVRVMVRPMLPSLQLRDDLSYLIIGGLKGLCGSVALTFARHGARSVIVMGRSGFEDRASRTAIQNIEAEGCNIFLVKGDVIKLEDVQRAFTCADKPVGGVVQGAMAVRGKLYQALTAEDYHYGAECKVRGTWNLHNVALASKRELDFFSILSSTSGVAGQSGQANYVAANAFLDAFALYRRRLGLRANSIALGPMWDVGYMSRNKSELPQTNVSTFTTISERLFHKIVEYSVLQQTNPINEESAHHLITGMVIPLQESSTQRSDARFSHLFGSGVTDSGKPKAGGSPELEAYRLLSSSQAKQGDILAALVQVVCQKLGQILQLNEPLEPAIAPSNYGMESLAAVELRNWIRMELQADVTILEILNATSLVGLSEVIYGKLRV